MSPLAVLTHRPRRTVLTVTANPAIDRTLWIPGFRTGTVNRVQHEAVRPGGKGINVAARLSELGVAAVATGLLGTAEAPMFEAFLDARGIVDRLVRRHGSTRTGIKIVDADGDDTTDINFAGEAPGADALEELERVVVELAPESSWVVLSGSLPPEVPVDLYARLCEIAHAGGALVAVDTSGEPLRHALDARPDLIKPNRDELQELRGRALDGVPAVLAAAEELRATGISTVVVSLGADGALFVDPQTAVLAEPLPIDVRSTVGAGDAMVAGTIAALLRGDRSEDVAAFATASAADAISTTPATPTPATPTSVTPTSARVEALASQVRRHTLRTEPQQGDEMTQRGTA